VAVGALGFVVQMTVAAALLAAGLVPVVAALLAIEAAVVTNHLWHRRWTWRERVGALAWPGTLLRAHLGAGGTSLVVGAGTVGALAGQVPPLAAQVIAVGLCAIANYWLADRWIFGGRDRSPKGPPVPTRPRPLLAVSGLLLLVAGEAHADGPTRTALQSWDRYASLLDRSRAADLARGVEAWATDDDPTGARVRAVVTRGEIAVTRRTVSGADVDDATLEHWQGSLLVRGVTLAHVAQRLRHPDRYPQPPDVLSLKVSGWSDDGHDLYLRLTRSLLISATYDTWHRVHHQARGPTRLDSTSLVTRIEEVHEAGTPAERRVRLEDSRGFLWRMQSYWRFTAVPEGVIVTCESISLSRPVPTGLGLISRPIITRVARESMTTALRTWLRGWHADR
jgi:putative flippase GtrA